VSGGEVAAKHGRTVSGMTSVQARAPVRRENGRKFRALGLASKSKVKFQLDFTAGIFIALL